MRAWVLVLFASTALAAAKPKVLIDAPAPMKALLTNALKKKFTPVPAKKPLSDSPLGNEVKTAVREAGAIGVVIARLNGGSWSVLVLNGADGTVLEQLSVNAPNKKPLKALPKGMDVKLQNALGDAKAPGKEVVKKEEPEPVKEEPKEEPKKEEPGVKKEELRKKEDPKKKEEPKKKDEPVVTKEEPVIEPEPSGEEKPVALRAGIGGRIFARRFFYQDDFFGSLSKYNLAVGPMVVIEADWFPGAHVTRGVLANIGLSFAFNYAVGITSVATDMTRYNTTSLRLRIGAQYRLAIGPLEVLPTLGYMTHTYSITSGAATASKPNIPDVAYSELRVGLGLRVKIIGPLSITAGFAYDAPLSEGEIGSKDYFPHLKAFGLDTNLGVAVGIGSRIEVRAGVDYIRYWYSLYPQVTDSGVALKRVAGGALDDYRSASLVVAFVL